LRRAFNSLTTKVLGLTLLVVIGSQLSSVFSILSFAERDFDERTQLELDRAAEVLYSALDYRARNVSSEITNLAEDPKFIAAVRSGNSATVTELLTREASSIRADMAMVVRPDGSIMAATDWRGINKAQMPYLTGQVRALMVNGNQAHEMFTIPILAPDLIGYVSGGYDIKDELAIRLADGRGIEVSILSSAQLGKVSILASSLLASERRMVANAIKQIDPSGSHIPAKQELDSYFLTKHAFYLENDTNVMVLFHKRLDEARQPFVILREQMLHAFGFSLIGAIVLAFFLSRAVSKPIRKLSLAASRMSVGNYADELNVPASGELKELVKAFEKMRKGIAEREKRIVYQAQFDALTALPNRIQAQELLREKLRDCNKDGQPVVVMMVHLQRFKEIQSSLGHEIGDDVLRQSAQRIRATLDEKHILARLEGDQFLIIAPDTDLDEGKQLARQLAGILDAGMKVQTVNVMMDACIGFAVSPEHGRQPDELLRRAAVAKNDANQGQKRICVYQNGREARHVRQLAILGDLRRAARENELELYLQPKVSLPDYQVCGAEVLLRWNHPELGQIPPFEFIPLAEHAGSISIITDWMLTRAIAQARSWKDQGIHLPVAVNLSAQDLLGDKLIANIEQELDAYGMDASCLICEITEEAVVQDFEHAIRVLSQLRDMGAKTSMDDFGTGYSSLEHLQQLPVDELKIDRTFVMPLPDHPGNSAIVRSVVQLAHNLGLEVVAEGVENIGALRWLREIGCERAQGYYLSKPMPASEFIGWVHNWKPADDLELRETARIEML